MRINALKTCRLTNPLGYNFGAEPRLSWIVEDTAGKVQKAARVEISLSESFDSTVYDSGMTELDSICCPVPVAMSPRTRYYWRVSVQTDAGEEAVSETAWFETGKLGEAWSGKWITPEQELKTHPRLFKDFELPDKPVRRARLYACGLGLYECDINDRRAGDEYLAPGFPAYDMWIPYQTYDVKDLLKSGENSISFLLGNGWYKGRFGLNRPEGAFKYGDEFALICELTVDFEDGSVFTLSSGTDWKSRGSAIVDSGIYDGETRDDTADCTAIYGVREAKTPAGKLEERRSPPVKIMRRVKPVELITTPAGERVLDMCQNMVGLLEFRCAAEKGGEVHLEFGEVLQGGNFYRDNLRSAKAEYRYISDGVEKDVLQSFTFYGFRYVRLTKWPGEASAEDFCGCVLYTDMEETGRIVTDNPLVNKLFENTMWGQRGNFLDVPTDCPQRDERMGWTGDAQVFFGTSAYNMDVYAFFSKYMYDMALEQGKNNGAPPVTIPAHGQRRAGACAWGDAAAIIPWGLYVRYGDKALLAEQYNGMKAWIDYIKGRDEARGGKRLWSGDFHFADWLALDGGNLETRFGGTDPVYLASAFYSYSASLVAKAARVLGNERDKKYYQGLSDEVRDAIRAEYFTPSGRLAVTTQTAYTLALYMDLVPEDKRGEIAELLRLKMKESGFCLRTGFIGTPYLCRVLSDSGSNDIAYRLLLREEYPGWLYCVKLGATTIWERWNSILPDGTISGTDMNSLNHYAYGSIVEWMYSYMAGIQSVEEHPGFRRFRLSPKPHHLLKNVECVFNSPVGEIKSCWKITPEGSLEFRFRVPFGAVAELHLPDTDGTGLPEIQELSAGEHVFKYLPAKPYLPKPGIDTPVSELAAYPEITAELAAVVNQWRITRELGGNLSLSEMASSGRLILEKELMDKITAILEK